MDKRKALKRQWPAALFAFLLLAAMLAAAFFGVRQVASATSQEGVTAARQAIERAAVLCYASEGFYPPSFAYIQENYGVQIDTQQYAVRYEVFASNVMPNVVVVER